MISLCKYNHNINFCVDRYYGLCLDDPLKPHVVVDIFQKWLNLDLSILYELLFDTFWRPSHVQLRRVYVFICRMEYSANIY